MEVPYDGIDQDCDGRDLTDVDGDRYDAVEAGGDDCDDDDAAVNPGAAEVWYDGVDQDCGGGSDYDQDGDGHDSDAYGGDDCDDTDATVHPGAVEIWYDGIDQDCGGSSDYDQDGDGYDSDAYDGDDCDDTDPGVQPSVGEVRGDGLDNDCDGWTDEWDVCPDGLGDFTEIQEAIDATAGESAPVLVLCPGTWHESVSFSGLNLTIVGGGEEPDEVVWQPGDSAILIDLGDDAETTLSLRNLYMLGDAELHQSAVQALNGGRFSFDGVGIDGFGAGQNFAISLWAQDYAIALDMVNTYVANSVYGGVLVGSTGSDVTVAVSSSIFSANETHDLYVSGSWYGGGAPIEQLSLSVTNSLFAAPASRAILLSDAFDGEILVSNNTFVGPMTTGSSGVTVIFASSYVLADTTIDSNEFVETAGESGYLWAGVWCAASDRDCDTEARGAEADAWPDTFAYNIGWNAYEDGLGRAMYADASRSSFDGVADMESGITLVDPLIALDTSPPYANPAGSPGIDAGNPDPVYNDPDGTRNDVGAYGGPGGDWWKESPWLTRL